MADQAENKKTLPSNPSTDDAYIIPEKVRNDFRHNPIMLETIERMLRAKPARN